MSFALEVDATDITQLGRQMVASQSVVAAESRIAMERSSILVQNAARQNIQQQKAIDTGRLLNSIMYGRPVKPFEAKIGTNLTYGKVVERGREAGAPMPPADVLLPWMSRHGIAAEFEFPIRRAIWQRGIKARPYLVPALEVNRAAINREFIAAGKRAAVKVTA